jgi:hypothetical protein
MLSIPEWKDDMGIVAFGSTSKMRSVVCANRYCMIGDPNEK